MIFADRYQAGQELASSLSRFRHENPIIIALPRGGVPIGYEVALALDAPLEVVVSRKLGAPFAPEFGFGAIAPGARVVDATSVSMLGLSSAEVEAIVAKQTKELQRREALFHGTVSPIDVSGRTVIVVDDGLATGVTARAAIASLRTRSPKKIIFAAPVCAPDSADTLRELADEVICISEPPGFASVGTWYENFAQTTDEEALELLEKARRRTPAPTVRTKQEAKPQEGKSL